MFAVIIIFAVTITVMIALILFKPSVKLKGFTLGTYWLATLIGVFAMLICGLISVTEIFENLTADTAVNPLKILTLFLSMSLMSIFLDETGFFKALASYVMNHAKASQAKLFFALYAVVSVLTVFTSNDIIILTFTPFICYFAKNTHINPIPYLLAEFVAANTWSMFLIIGNPTNIYLATAAGLDFADYLAKMWLPTILAGITSATIIYLLFRKELKRPISPTERLTVTEDKPLMYLGLVHLGIATVLLIISPYIGLEMWIISLCFAFSLFILALLIRLIKREKPVAVLAALRHAPWELIPFVLSMFVFVLALEKYGITDSLASALGQKDTILVYGLSSALAANVINNIPMSVLFSSIVARLPAKIASQGLFAAIIGSNVGAFLTPMGALAGIMWMGILKKQEVNFSFLRFVLYGSAVAIPTLFAALSGLYITIFLI